MLFLRTSIWRKRISDMGRQPWVYIISLALAACGPAPNDPGPGGVTVGEAKALDEAAEMLDERNAPLADVVEEPTIKE
jgi:hypothetical protein